jgi:hypothetical protein
MPQPEANNISISGSRIRVTICHRETRSTSVQVSKGHYTPTYILYTHTLKGKDPVYWVNLWYSDYIREREREREGEERRYTEREGEWEGEREGDRERTEREEREREEGERERREREDKKRESLNSGPMLWLCVCVHTHTGMCMCLCVWIKSDMEMVVHAWLQVGWRHRGRWNRLVEAYWRHKRLCDRECSVAGLMDLVIEKL